MAIGGDSWATATDLAIDGPASDPSPSEGYPIGTSRPYHAAWWKFSASADGYVTVDTHGTTGSYPDTVLYVYSGTEASPVQVGYSDDDGDVEFYTSETTFAVTAGITYHIKVGTYGSSDPATDAYVVKVTSFVPAPPPEPAPNDNFAAAQALGVGQTGGPYVALGNTVEADELQWLGSRAMHSVWFKFTPTTSDPVRITMSPTVCDNPYAVDLGINILSGAADATLNNLTWVGDDYGRSATQDRGYLPVYDMISPTPGVTYYIGICSYSEVADTLEYALAIKQLYFGPRATDSEQYSLFVREPNHDTGGLTWNMSGIMDGNSDASASAALSAAFSGEQTAYPGNPPYEPKLTSGFSSWIRLTRNFDNNFPSSYSSFADWWQAYHWIDMGDPWTPGSWDGSVSDLPPTVWDANARRFVDPDVVAVVWDKPIPIGSRTIQFRTSSSTYIKGNGTWRIMFRIDGDSTVDPPDFMTRDQILANFAMLPQVLDTTLPGDTLLPEWDITAETTGFDIFQGQRITFTIADERYLLDGEAPPASIDNHLSMKEMTFRQEYVVPYRLVYKTPQGQLATVSWWDGSARQDANVLGWWDGSAVQPVALRGWWDSSTTQPVLGGT